MNTASHSPRRPSHVIDILTTCLDVAGVAYPATYGGHAIQPLQGESFAPALTAVAGGDTRAAPLFWEHEGHCAVRDGDWKLVSRTVAGSNGPWELYNLEADRTELDDLAAQEPERVAGMARAYARWAEQCGVLAVQDGKLVPQP